MFKMKTKQKDWTKLASYTGLTLDQAMETLKSKGLMLAFGKDAWAIEVLRTFQDHNDEAGVAALTAALFVNKHGAAKTATTATGIYMELSKEANDEDMIHRVRNLEFMVYFADHGGTTQKLEWPIVWTLNDSDKRGGLANIMLHMAMIDLGKLGSSTSDTVAAFGIQRFFEESKKLRKIRKAA